MHEWMEPMFKMRIILLAFETLLVESSDAENTNEQRLDSYAMIQLYE